MKWFCNTLCSFFGHKTPEEYILAYSIDIMGTHADIRIYQVYVCPRCGKIARNRIDKQERYSWYADYLAREEEEKMRKNNIVSIAEAYQMLQEKKSSK